MKHNSYDVEMTERYIAGRSAREVRIGRVTIGGGHPVAPQSMTACSTMDTAACVEQIGRIHAAGCDIVRLTTQNRREAENLREIRAAADAAGLEGVALVADVHFNPEVALTAAEYADKVRINPGNFGDAGEKFMQLLEKCRRRSIPIRIGVNHGSLAQHVVERWGDTPQGMVEAAMEYLRVCQREGFGQVVVSMKSSNVRVMVHAYRLLAAAMDAEGMDYPLHLGVTEAGDGMDGRVKSAVGIGTLLGEGLGDTIRVSLTEPPENEIPVAREIIGHFERQRECFPKAAHAEVATIGGQHGEVIFNPYEYNRRATVAEGNIGGGQPPVLYGELDEKARAGITEGRVVMLADNCPPHMWRRRIVAMQQAGDRRPVILCRTYHETSSEALQVQAGCEFGSLFVDGLADGMLLVNAADPAHEQDDRIALAVMQAARVRMSHTEFIACPGCGRTLFDIRASLAAVRARTSHLAGLKIAVMGCIVNGPGEMADADYGYVGEGSGRVSLYRSRELVRRSIPESEAVDALVALIAECGDWHDPR